MADGDYEYQTLTLAVDEHIAETLQRLAAEGWEISPGSAPVAVYHLRRTGRPVGTPMATVGGIGRLTIDESKIHIIRDGKIVT